MVCRLLPLAIASACFAVVALGQVGTDGSVKDTGGPLREASVSLGETSGPVRESVAPFAPNPGRLGGWPVSAGSRGVYGSGSVHDGTAGCVSDLKRAPVPVFAPPPAFIPLAPTDASLAGLHRTIRHLQPSDREDETAADQEADQEHETPPEAAEADSLAEEPDATLVDEPGLAAAIEPEQHEPPTASDPSSADESELLLGEKPAQ